MVTAKMTSKGQITLPKELRKMLNVQAGSVLVFEKDDDKIVIKAARTFKEFKGFLKNRGKSNDFDEMRKEAKKHAGRKAARNGKE